MKRLLLLSLLLASQAQAQYLGDFLIGQTVKVDFTTYNVTNGASITITGLAVTDVEIYKGTSMTQRGGSDNGIVLIDTDGIDLDSTTGWHGFTIDTGDNSDAGFYEPGFDYSVVVNSITVNSQTVVGKWSFSIANRSDRPIESGKAQAGTSTTIQLSARTNLADDILIGSTVYVYGGTGAGQRAYISDWVSSTDTATIVTQYSGNTWLTNPDNTSLYRVDRTLQGILSQDALGNLNANVAAVSGDAPAADTLEACLDGAGCTLANTTIGAVTTTGTVSGNVTLADNGLSAAKLASDAVTEIVAGVSSHIVEPNGSVTLKCALQVALSILAGTYETVANTTTFKDPSGTSTRVVGTVSGSSKSGMTLSCS